MKSIAVWEDVIQSRSRKPAGYELDCHERKLDPSKEVMPPACCRPYPWECVLPSNQELQIEKESQQYGAYRKFSNRGATPYSGAPPL